MVRIGWPWRAADDGVQLIDRAPRPAEAPSSVLFRIAAEAVILQDEAEAVLSAVARHDHLGVVAPQGGPLVRRFFSLRDELPTGCADPQLDRLSTVLDTIFYHHAMQVATALEFLAFDGRSEEMHHQISRFTGLGPPAELLDSIYDELKQRQ